VEALIALIVRVSKSSVAILPDTPLLSSGLVDSYHLVELLVALEEAYGIHIESADAGADNFNTPRDILRFIEGSR
jgi:acyl carrier protein